MRRAAMLALWVADDYLILRGERAIANGWFQRAARILEGLETCPEHGWLDALLGYVATVDGDPAKAKALAARARVLGREVEVVSLEMFALAVEGLALVNEGEVVDGMRCLDEATAAALAGEFEEIVAAGWTFCFLLNACERVRDFERAGEWCRKVEVFSRRMRTNFVTLACKGPLRRSAHLARALARGGAGAYRGDRAPRPGAAFLERAGDRAACRLAAPPGTLRRGRGSPRATAGKPARAGGDGRARPRPRQCFLGS